MKKILITGGAGMIGSNLVKRLVQDNAGDIIVADNLWRGKLEYLFDESGTPVIDLENNFFKVDLRNPESCKTAVQNVEEVYHLADIVAGINYVFDNQVSVYHDNSLIDTNILRASSEAGVKRFLYVGTACSYPKGLQTGVDAPPLVEDDIFPAEPESAYGWSKLSGELQTGFYGLETSMTTDIIRFHNVYGHPSDYSPERSQVIPSLILKALNSHKAPFVVWGSGAQGRSFIHVKDVVNGMVLMMNKAMGKGPIQLGTDYCTSIRELAETIVKISGKQIDIIYDTTKPEGDKGRCADCKRAEERLGWTPQISLEQGLAELYHWIENQIKSSDGV